MRWLLALLLLMLPLAALAQQPLHDPQPLQFRDDAEERRFHDLAAQLRCVQCQNQSLADSNAQIAQDLRRDRWRVVAGYLVLALVWILSSDAAVQVLAYETRMQLLGAQPAADAEPGFREQAASHEQMESFFAQLGDTLDEIDFHKGRAPESAMRKLRRLFLRSEPSEQEVRLLRGILADTQRMARLAQAGNKDS